MYWGCIPLGHAETARQHTQQGSATGRSEAPGGGRTRRRAAGWRARPARRGPRAPRGHRASGPCRGRARARARSQPAGSAPAPHSLAPARQPLLLRILALRISPQRSLAEGVLPCTMRAPQHSAHAQEPRDATQPAEGGAHAAARAEARTASPAPPPPPADAVAAWLLPRPRARPRPRPCPRPLPAAAAAAPGAPASPPPELALVAASEAADASPSGAPRAGGAALSRPRPRPTLRAAAARPRPRRPRPRSPWPRTAAPGLGSASRLAPARVPGAERPPRLPRPPRPRPLPRPRPGSAAASSVALGSGSGLPGADAAPRSPTSGAAVGPASGAALCPPCPGPRGLPGAGANPGEPGPRPDSRLAAAASTSAAARARSGLGAPAEPGSARPRGVDSRLARGALGLGPGFLAGTPALVCGPGRWSAGACLRKHYRHGTFCR